MATIFIDIKIKICINSDIFKVIVDIQDIRLHYGIVEGFYNINGSRKNTSCNLALCQIYQFIMRKVWAGEDTERTIAVYMQDG